MASGKPPLLVNSRPEARVPTTAVSPCRRPCRPIAPKRARGVRTGRATTGAPRRSDMPRCPPRAESSFAGQSKGASGGTESRAARPLTHAHAVCFASRSRAHGWRRPLLHLLRGLQRVHGQGRRPGRVRGPHIRRRLRPELPANRRVRVCLVYVGASSRARTTSSACTTARR